MGTHPIFESDFDCLTGRYGRKMTDSDDDDMPVLSDFAQQALQQFLAEQQAAAQIEQEMLEQGEGNKKAEVELKEDWQLSQFWYDESTCEAFSKIIIGELGRRSILKTGKVIFISSPTAFKHLMANKVLPQEQMHLLEYDKRFEAFSNFSFWDYNDPINLDDSLKAQFDLILMDPPFLNADTFGKTFAAVEWLRRNKECSIMVSSGVITHEFIRELDPSIKLMNFVPRHKNNLSNEFSLQSNFDADQYLTKDS